RGNCHDPSPAKGCNEVATWRGTDVVSAVRDESPRLIVGILWMPRIEANHFRCTDTHPEAGNRKACYSSFDHPLWLRKECSLLIDSHYLTIFGSDTKASADKWRSPSGREALWHLQCVKSSFEAFCRVLGWVSHTCLPPISRRRMDLVIRPT